MEAFFHSLRGYVRIRVWGYSPERFINLCANRDILLWDIENHGAYYTMCISLAGFWQLRPITAKTKTRAAILQRYGLPFFLPRVKKRGIFLAGLAGCLLFLYLMSHYIWTIEIEGNTALTTDLLLTYLEENRIAQGTKKSALDIEALEKGIRRRFPIVTWTSARLEGTKLVIQIRENDRSAPQIEEAVKSGMDLEAERGGRIVRMVTRSGVPLVKIGDEVEAGQVLVSGAVPVYGEDAAVREYMFCQADADIYLEYPLRYTERIPTVCRYKTYSGDKKTVPYLQICGVELRMPFGKPDFERSDCVVSVKQAQVFGGLTLPFCYGSYCYREYSMSEKTYTKDQMLTLCEEKLAHVMETLEEKGVQILQKDVKIEKGSRYYVMEADFTVVEKTGKTVPGKIKDPPVREESKDTGSGSG